MARGPKTRFAEYALAHDLDSAAKAFPGAFDQDQLSALKSLPEQQRKDRLEELFRYWQAFDDALDD